MSYTGDEQTRSNRTNYSLRNVPTQDYSRQLRGPPTSRSLPIVKTNQETDMEQLAATLTELTQFQQEQQHRLQKSKNIVTKKRSWRDRRKNVIRNKRSWGDSRTRCIRSSLEHSRLYSSTCFRIFQNIQYINDWFL